MIGIRPGISRYQMNIKQLALRKDRYGDGAPTELMEKCAPVAACRSNRK